MIWYLGFIKSIICSDQVSPLFLDRNCVDISKLMLFLLDTEVAF
jgi:hypothetical protein